MLKVHIKSTSNHPLPSYATCGSAGMDLIASIDEEITLIPGGRALIPTGVHIALPEGYEAQVRSRSGLAINYGVVVLNSPGTIDSDYRGEINVILINHGIADFVVKNGMKIAQLVICPYIKVEWTETNTLLETERGVNGFGSTGL